jgi:hypothetical protein
VEGLLGADRGLVIAGAELCWWPVAIALCLEASGREAVATLGAKPSVLVSARALATSPLMARVPRIARYAGLLAAGRRYRRPPGPD